MQVLDLIAGIAWDPNIRGVLVVLTGISVLFGSIWFIVSTNSGFRLGTLLSLAALFGFMTILAGYWWVTSPNAWKGTDPSWVVVDINTDDHNASVVDDVRELPDHAELVTEYGTAYDLVVASGSEQATADFNSPPSEDELAGLEPEAAQRLIDDRRLRNENINYSDLEGVDPEVIENADLDFGGWDLLAAADAGEPQTVAAAELIELGVFDDATQFLNLEAFEIGGKPKLTQDPNRLDRIGHWFANAARLTHPPHYVVVTVQGVDQDRIADLTVAGAPPPRPIVDEDAPIVSVVMLRDLGDRRLPPALLTIASALIFAALCYVLHVRDKVSMARNAATR